MAKGITRIIKYVLYFLFGSIIYGFVLFIVYTQLAGYSLLLAYLGNLALIIIALVADNYTFKIYDAAMQSRKHVEEFRKSRFLRFQLDSYISYKTTLYLFYIFILFFSQIVNSGSVLLNEDLMSFISANEYSILLLIAVDLLIRQFAKDREKSNMYREKIEKYLTENADVADDQDCTDA